MNNFDVLEKNFRKTRPYTPGEQPAFEDKIKLNTNENPYPPSPLVKKALADFNSDSLKLYPDPNASKLKRAIANRCGVSEDMVFVGVGSDDVLAMCFMAFFNSGKPILFPDVTYSFYPVWADLFGIKYKTPALDENFRINPRDYLTDNGGIVFPNPNAPTGLELPQPDIELILRENSGSIVIVDEAYVDFGAKSALPLLEKYDNLVVVQTFSKSRSLAGIRIGYAVAGSRLTEQLERVKNSYNSYTLNAVSIEVGTAAIADEEYFRECCGKIIATRERAKKELSLLGFEFGDSKSNFIFAKHKTAKARDIFEALRRERIFVRYFGGGRTSDYLRITVGTDDEIDRLLDFLRSYLKKPLIK